MTVVRLQKDDFYLPILRLIRWGDQPRLKRWSKGWWKSFPSPMPTWRSRTEKGNAYHFQQDCMVAELS